MKKFVNYNPCITRSYSLTNRMIIRNAFYLFSLSLLFFCPISFAIDDYMIIEIIHSGNAAVVDKLIQDGDLKVNQTLKIAEEEFPLWQTVDNEYTPLMVAAKSGPIKIVTNLIKQGARINQQLNNMTALMHAAAWGNKDVVMFLINKGADVHVKNSNNSTVLMLAVLGYSTTVSILLMQYLEEKNPGCLTNIERLVKVASGFDVEAVKQLVTDKTDAEVQNIISAIPLARDNKIQIITSLIKSGVNINAQDKWGNTALMCAVTTQQIEIIRPFVENKADINIQNKNGVTALMCAAEGGSTEIVKRLLNRNADTNIQNDDGDTALICAAKCKSAEAVKLLLDNGADANAKDQHGSTALIYAAEKQSTESTEIVKILLENGANINTQNEDDNTALLCAAKHKNIETVGLLFFHEADVNTQDKYGNTA
ncbi:MAG: ankyrin repeat domain-containing protein, partial [Endozoicomonadaceae bacterium]|nr:ankyrin repeat domain-containing protein [Endozoicomonadaceae bacterium]